MIRGFYLFIVFLWAFILPGTNIPADAQTNVFIGSGKDKEESKDESRPRIYLPSDKAGSSAGGLSSKKFLVKKKLTNNTSFEIYKKARTLDPALLSMAGPEPTTQEELKLIAAAHREATMAAMLEQRKRNQALVDAQARKTKQDIAKAMRLAEARQVADNAPVPKTKQRVVNEQQQQTLKKPTKVFTNYR